MGDFPKASAGIYARRQPRTTRRDSSLQSARKFLLANAGNAQAHTSNARARRCRLFSALGRARLLLEGRDAKAGKVVAENQRDDQKADWRVKRARESRCKGVTDLECSLSNQTGWLSLAFDPITVNSVWHRLVSGS